jgi:hypothetical protein
MLPAIDRYFDRFESRRLVRQLAYQPFPFVFPLQQLEPNITGYVDAGKEAATPMVWLASMFLFMGALMFLCAVIARGVDLLVVLFIGTTTAGFGLMSIGLSRHQSKTTRTLTYNSERRETAVSIWRRGAGLIANTAAPASECRVLLHPIALGSGRGARSMYVGNGFALMMHVKGTRFPIAAVRKKDEALDLWAKLPEWVTSVDAGDGEQLDLVSDRKLA